MREANNSSAWGSFRAATRCWFADCFLHSVLACARPDHTHCNVGLQSFSLNAASCVHVTCRCQEA
jgi:hypothetical protein